MKTTRLVQTNRSQAVRLPRDVAFAEDVREVRIFREGHRRVIVPAGRSWDDFFDSPGDSDFPGERAQPEAETRTSL